ncbi:MAG: hypothetical protein KAS16_00170 [Thermoplasmata archaeon]|nr:hypothetical protein [Thermoplasmata archaeon]
MTNKSNNKIYNRIESEIRALFGVTVINLVMAALLMGIGISIAITQITQALDGGNWLIIPFAAILGLVCAGVGIWWIISTVSVLESVSNIQDQFSSLGPRKSVTEIDLTQSIVQLLATYRLNKPKIKQMMKVSYWAGILFAFGGMLQGFAFFIQYLDGMDGLELLTGIVGLSVILSMSVVFFLVHRKYQSYSRVYDRRISKNKESENTLKESMGGLE